MSDHCEQQKDEIDLLQNIINYFTKYNKTLNYLSPRKSLNKYIYILYKKIDI